MNIREIKSNEIKNNENSSFENLDKNKYNKMIYNKNDIDLDLLFEKQLQKLREINREYEYESNDNDSKKEMTKKIIMNYNTFNNDIKEIKLDNENKNNKIINFNEDNCDSENINKINKKNIRPFSHYSNNNNLLPKISIQHHSQKYLQKEENIPKNNLFIKNVNSKLRSFSPTIKSPLHKDFGKVPKYLKEMKIKAEMLKNLENKKKEEEKYPKGTRLLSEEERLFTLKKLKESKKELENLIEKLPITLNSLSSRNKQQKLYKELDEIEQAILTFSKTQVFVKIDS